MGTDQRILIEIKKKKNWTGNVKEKEFDGEGLHV